MLKGWKTFLFFTITGILGLIAALEAIDVKSILFPLICHVPAEAQIVADECTEKVIKLAGAWSAGISAAGIFLRAITTSAIFKAIIRE